MQPSQITFPFRPKRIGPQSNSNADLIGRSYPDGEATVTVIETCLDDPRRVIVKRDIDGRTWSMPSWLMRFVVNEKKKRRAA